MLMPESITKAGRLMQDVGPRFLRQNTIYQSLAEALCYLGTNECVEKHDIELSLKLLRYE